MKPRWNPVVTLVRFLEWCGSFLVYPPFMGWVRVRAEDGHLFFAKQESGGFVRIGNRVWHLRGGGLLGTSLEYVPLDVFEGMKVGARYEIRWEKLPPDGWRLKVFGFWPRSFWLKKLPRHER